MSDCPRPIPIYVADTSPVATYILTDLASDSHVRLTVVYSSPHTARCTPAYGSALTPRFPDDPWSPAGVAQSSSCTLGCSHERLSSSTEVHENLLIPRSIDRQKSTMPWPICFRVVSTFPFGTSLGSYEDRLGRRPTPASVQIGRQNVRRVEEDALRKLRALGRRRSGSQHVQCVV
jgi:hypothetical protein